MGDNRDRPAVIEAHQQAALTIDTTPSSDLSQSKRNKHEGFMPSDVLRTDELKLEKDYNDVALLPSRMYKIMMKV